MMIILLAILAVLAAGISAAAVDRWTGRHVGWLALLAGGTWYGWPADWSEQAKYKIFLAGAFSTAALGVYGLAKLLGRHNGTSGPRTVL
jgi:hypothetical protein